RGQARRALEGEPQGRLARDGGNDERTAIARVRQHQATGTAAQAQRMSAQAAIAAGARASSCLRSATRLAPLLHALGAFASVRLEKDVEIFPPVVVGDLLARLDLLPRAQDHLALDHVGFGVRTARVIGIAAHVAAARAVDGEAAVDLVHVAAAARLEPLGLRIGDAAPLVFDDEGAVLDRLGREQPEAGRRAADAVGLARGFAGSFARHDGRRAAYAACSALLRVTSSRVSTGTGARNVLMPGQPAKANRSTSLSLSSGASLVTRRLIVTLRNADIGASAIICPRASNSVRATASKPS